MPQPKNRFVVPLELDKKPLLSLRDPDINVRAIPSFPS
jgi:hypothetical protein